MSQYYSFFIKTNAALVSITEFYQKLKKKSYQPQLLSSVYFVLLVRENVFFFWYKAFQKGHKIIYISKYISNIFKRLRNMRCMFV